MEEETLGAQLDAQFQSIDEDLNSVIDANNHNAKVIDTLADSLDVLNDAVDAILARLEKLENGKPDNPGGNEKTSVRAASLLKADILAAINEAGPGGMVLLPAGYTAPLDKFTIPFPIHIKGAGVDKDGNWLTSIRRLAESDLTLWEYLGDGLTVEGIEFIGTIKHEPARDTGLRFVGRDNWAHNCRFRNFGNAGLSVSVPEDDEGTLNSGLASECVFINMPDTFGLGYGVSISGGKAHGTRQAWDKPIHPGDVTEAFVVEDCYFERCRRAMDVGRCGRAILRNNEVVWTAPNSVYIATHGPIRPEIFGARWVEIYTNTCHSRGETTHLGAIKIRGGDAVVFENSMADCRHFLILDWQPVSNAKWFTKDQRDAVAFQKTQNLHIWDNLHEAGREQVMHHTGGTDEVLGTHVKHFEAGRHYKYEPRPFYVKAPYPHPYRA